MLQQWKLQMMASHLFYDYLEDTQAIIEFSEKLLQATANSVNEAMEANAEEIAEIDRKIQKLENRINGYSEMRADGDITREIFLKKKAECEAEISSLQKQRSDLLPDDFVEDAFDADYKEKLAILKKALEDCKDFDKERIIPDEVIDAFVVKIVAHEDGLDWYLRFKPDPEDPVKCHVDGDKRKGGKTPTFAYGGTGCYLQQVISSRFSGQSRFHWERRRCPADDMIHKKTTLHLPMQGRFSFLCKDLSEFLKQGKEIIDHRRKHDRGKKIRDLDFCDSHQIGADHDDQQGTGAGHFIDGTRTHERREQSGEQNESALDDKYRDRRQKDSHAQTGGEHHGGHQVQHGFGDEDGIVARQPCLDGAGHRHGADAEQEGRRDKSFRKRDVFAGFLEPGFDFSRKRVDGAVDVQKRSDNGAEHDRSDQDQYIFSAEAAGNADVQRTGTEPGHGGTADSFGDPLFEQQADARAEDYGNNINNDTKHKIFLRNFDG